MFILSCRTQEGKSNLHSCPVLALLDNADSQVADVLSEKLELELDRRGVVKKKVAVVILCLERSFNTIQSNDQDSNSFVLQQVRKNIDECYVLVP